MSTGMERVETTSFVLNSMLVRLQWKQGVPLTLVVAVSVHLVKHAECHVRLYIHPTLSRRCYRFYALLIAFF